MLSEWQDSNLRPLAPHASMLANCTTPRYFYERLLSLSPAWTRTCDHPDNPLPGHASRLHHTPLFEVAKLIKF